MILFCLRILADEQEWLHFWFVALFLKLHISLVLFIYCGEEKVFYSFRCCGLKPVLDLALAMESQL